MNKQISEHELLAAWQTVVDQLVHLPEVQAFQQAEQKIIQHEQIHQLREQIKQEQKAMVNAKHYGKTESFQQHQAKIASFEAELELIPLWHQYQALKIETNALVQAVIGEIETTLG